MPLPPSSPPSAPFILLDDGSATQTGGARLYQAPQEVVVARHAAEVAPALARITVLAEAGLWCAGTIAYEAGLALEPRLAPLAPPRTGADGPLVWFGAFAGCQRLPAAQVPGWLAAHADASLPSRLGPLEPALSPGGYARAFAAMRAAIVAGDIYQANLTLPLLGHWQGDPLAIYAALRGAGGGAHGALVCDGTHWLLSFSPELFFATEAGEVMVRPMKGTRPRGATPQHDAALAADLATHPKDRAENLMILDLMRNDLARIAVPGSVRVEAPFAIESYPTVHQMVSTVRARLKPGVGAVEVLRALFPCGSVTGAPKIRAMELIDAHEAAPRGAYCGAIGHIDPPTAGAANEAGGAAFNVAIRTLRLSPDGAGPGFPGGGTAVLGVGSAVVADSACLAEWRECGVKGGFVHQPKAELAQAVAGIAQFDLIETMRFTPEEGVPLLALHLARIGASADALGFTFDRHAARNAIQALCFAAEDACKLRLMLARSGATSLEIAPLPAPLDAAGPVPCAVLPLPVEAGDWRLAHKTSDRGFYDAGLAAGRAAGAGETLFIRDDGRLTEGCFTSLFVEREGRLHTPPAPLGLLPGVLRAHLLAEGRAVEGEVTLDDLAHGFFIGNALRGLMPARLLG